MHTELGAVEESTRNRRENVVHAVALCKSDTSRMVALRGGTIEGPQRMSEYGGRRVKPVIILVPVGIDPLEDRAELLVITTEDQTTFGSEVINRKHRFRKTHLRGFIN